MLCENGHNICNICRPKFTHCPTCEQQFLNTRNVALEELATEVKYPCVYRNYGSREIYSFDLIGEHKEKCQYIPQSCLVNKLNIGFCTWTGISSSMKSHLKQAHASMCMEYYGRYQDSIHISGVTPNIGRAKFIFTGDAILCSRSKITNDVFYSVLQYTGPAADAAKYSYRLEFFNKEHKEGLSKTLLATSLDEDLSEIHNAGNCVKLYPEQFNRFTNEGSELAFSIVILTLDRNFPHCLYRIFSNLIRTRI